MDIQIAEAIRYASDRLAQAIEKSKGNTGATEQSLMKYQISWYDSSLPVDVAQTDVELAYSATDAIQQ